MVVSNFLEEECTEEWIFGVYWILKSKGVSNHYFKLLLLEKLYNLFNVNYSELIVFTESIKRKKQNICWNEDKNPKASLNSVKWPWVWVEG